MNKKTRKEKSSSNSQKKIEREDEDMNEYEDSYDGEEIKEDKKEEYDEYELPNDFIISKEEEEKQKEELNWFNRRKKAFITMDNNQRLYWIKILSGVILGLILGLAGAQTGWWLFLMLGIYGAIAGGGMYFFKLKWHWKEILFSGFFPYVALFWMFWTLMFTSLYAPPRWIWETLLITTQTVITNTTTYTTTYTMTTSPAGFPILAILFTVVATLALMQLLLRKYRKNI